MKRIILFIITNLAVTFLLVIAFTLICRFFNIDTAVIRNNGVNYMTLAVLSLVFGMSGSLISLLLSKPIAKFSVHAVTVDGRENEEARWLVSVVSELAERANIKTPEVAIYQGAPNAFATGAFRNSALVAVSTGILAQMSRSEVRAVLGHEISHVANGDMVTMSLLQGIINTFVIFAAYVVGYAVDNALSSEKRRGPGIGFHLTRIVCQIVFGILASMIIMAYSRRREYAADADSAKLIGSPQPMINALRRLGGLNAGALPSSLKAMGISGERVQSLFASHPPIEKRIAALQNYEYSNGSAQ